MRISRKTVNVATCSSSAPKMASNTVSLSKQFVASVDREMCVRVSSSVWVVFVRAFVSSIRACKKGKERGHPQHTHARTCMSHAHTCAHAHEHTCACHRTCREQGLCKMQPGERVYQRRVPRHCGLLHQRRPRGPAWPLQKRRPFPRVRRRITNDIQEPCLRHLLRQV